MKPSIKLYGKKMDYRTKIILFIAVAGSILNLALDAIFRIGISQHTKAPILVWISVFATIILAVVSILILRSNGRKQN